MSSESVIDGEELENVPLVRMEDVQPDRTVEYVTDSQEVYETYIIDGEYEECVVKDGDSDIGSMVSVKSEEHSEPEELEPTDEYELSDPIKGKKPNQIDIISKTNQTERWPTLEILPGGVINLGDKIDSTDKIIRGAPPENTEKMFACAKCSQSFKYLFCLVKHVKWHEEEAKKGLKGQKLSKFGPMEKKIAELKRRGTELDEDFSKRNVLPDPIQINPLSNVCTISYVPMSTRKRKVTKSRMKRAPKRTKL